MKIILLIGPSSAGKSTLCEELKKSHHCKIISDDDIFLKILRDRGNMKIPFLVKAMGEELLSELNKFLTNDQIFLFCNLAHLKMTKEGEEIVNTNFGRFDKLSNLEQVLKNANQFDENQISHLSQLLRKASVKAIKVDNDYSDKNPFPSIREEVYQAAFNHPDAEETLILDVVPDMHGNTRKDLERFEVLSAEYRKKNKDLSTYTVLAFAPPQNLSQRIKQRNLDADRNNNLGDKREGLFPFLQLGDVITSENKKDNKSQQQFGELSKKDLLNISNSHSSHKKPHDQAAEFVNLTKKFGLWQNPQAIVPLSIRSDLMFDVNINMMEASATPQSLTEVLFQKLTDIDQQRSIAKTLTNK